VAIWFGLSVTGKVAPENEKPAPVGVAALTVTGTLPLEVRVTGSVVAVLVATLPNERLATLTVNAGLAALSWMEKFCEVLPEDALMVAVCAVLTEAAVAVKDALVEPAATVTDAGTVTALLLLASVTLAPPLGAAALRVTVQASVPEPVMEALVQLIEPSVARPVPLRLMVVVLPAVALLVMVSVPVAAPAEVGSNCT
jgi:hypothetical protein